MSMKEKPRKWRALTKLVYSDLIPEKAGQPLAEQGEITELYPEIVALPDRIRLLETMGFIEPVPEIHIARPDKTEKE